MAASPWFADLGEPLELSLADAREVLRASGRLLQGEAAAVDALPRRLASDRAPRIVIISASDGSARARVGVGAGLGLASALSRSVAAVGDWPASRPAKWLRLDVVARASPVALSDSDDEPLAEIERRQEGIAWGPDSGFLQLPGRPTNRCGGDCDAGAVAARAATCESEWRGRAERGAASREPRPARLWRFSTAAYFWAGGDVVELYRGHRPRPAVRAEVLLDSVRAAGDYLRRATGDDGAFLYSYLAQVDRAEDAYNMVRHAGTVYAMLRLWEVTRDPELLAAAERAIGYLLRYVEPYRPPSAGASVLAYHGKIKLGGVALATLALIEHMVATGSRAHLEVAQRLCRYMALSQLSSGAFVHSREHPGGRARDFTSRYYPGEAVLALTRMHTLDGDETWLDVAERGARYLIEVRDSGVPTGELDHDHWLLYGLDELYRKRPREEFLRHAMRIATAIVRAQNRAPEPRDQLGAYSDRPRSAPVATRSEGLLAAYALARDFGDPAMARRIRETLELNVGFQLLTQVSPDRALFLPAPARALGGFTASLTNFRIRIDTVQHNISALLGVYLLLSEETAGGQNR